MKERPDGGSNPADAGAETIDDAGLDRGLKDAGPHDDEPHDDEPHDSGEPDADPDHPSLLEEDPSFDLGVSSGLDLEDAPMVWTRYAPAGATSFRLATWPLDAPDDVTVTDIASSEVEIMGDGQRLFVPLPGALSGERYGFCFLSGPPDQALRSALGTLRVPAAPGDLPSVTLGISSCTHYNATPYSALEQVSAQGELDVFVFSGDTVYADGATTYDAYQPYWVGALGQEGYRRARSNAPVLATWDDHEVWNNWNPETRDPAQITAARDAFFDHLPLVRDPEDPNRIWRSHRFGDTLEVIVLDCRSERLPSTRARANATYISAVQMQWLKDRLTNSPCVFKAIVNSVPITDLPLAFDSDKWQGYPAQRNEILSFIDDQQLTGVIWLAGDVHFGAAGRVGRAGNLGENQIEILAGPAGQNQPNLQALLCQAPQFDWAAATENIATVRFDPQTGQAHVRFIGSSGLLAEFTYDLVA